MKESRQPEQRVEQLVRWSEVTILAAKTNEQLNVHKREPLTGQQVQTLQQLQEILKSADPIPKALLSWVETTQQQAHKTVQWDALVDLATALSPRVCVGELNYRRAPNGLESHDAKNIRDTATYLEQVPTRDIVTLSDSHTATAYALLAAEETGWNLGRTAVLSFDRHTDYMPEEKYSVVKATVMSDLLQRTQVPAVAVVGTYYHPKYEEQRGDKKTINFLSGEDVIWKGKPDHAAFQAWMTKQIVQWQERGIDSIYTTVDLDCLRLYEQGYTGTDYSPTSVITQLLKSNELANIVQAYNGNNAAELVHRIKFQMDARELYGIPASWIGRALDMAKQQGLQIGVTHPNKPKRLIGDVVEYMTPDNQQRTAKITKALLTRLVSAAQH